MRIRPYELNFSFLIHHDDAREPVSSMYRPQWRLIIAVLMAAIFLIGVGVTDGIR